MFIQRNRLDGLRYLLLICLIIVGLAAGAVADARVVDDVAVKTVDDGYVITFTFLSSLQYNSATPRENARDFFIQLSAVNFSVLPSSEVASIKERQNLGWDSTLNLPLEEITYDGTSPERPQVILRFTEDVSIDVVSGADLKSLVVHVKTNHPPRLSSSSEGLTQDDGSRRLDNGATQELPQQIIPDDKDLAGMMAEARIALETNDLERAIQLYTKILLTAQGDDRKQAQELLGVSRERKGQYAHAKSEYEKYIAEYPQGPDGDRVRQRLAGLITAAQIPQGPLKEAKHRRPATEWLSQYYGSFSQFYNFDQTEFNEGDFQNSRNDMTADIDLNSKWRSRDYDINARFTGGHKQTFLEGEQDEYSLSSLLFDVKDKGHGL